jgi:hypothetical protein
MSDSMERALKDPAGLLKLAGEEEMAGVMETLWRLALDDGESKAARKSAKKALYILKSRGVDVDRHKPEESPKGAVKGTDAERVEAAFLTAPDSTGSSLLVFDLSDGKGLTHTLCQAVVHPEGVRSFTSRQASKKALERLLEQNPELFPVPPGYALARLREASEKGGFSGASALESAPAPLRKGGLLLHEGIGDVPHPALALFPPGLSRILQPDEERRLFAMPEIARISLFGDDVPRFKELVERAKKSRLIVGNRSPDERVSDVLESFQASHFNPERRAVYGRMLLDIALSLHARGSREEAKTLVEYGKSLLIPGKSLKDHPMVRYLVYKEFLLEQ